METRRNLTSFTGILAQRISGSSEALLSALREPLAGLRLRQKQNWGRVASNFFLLSRWLGGAGPCGNFIALEAAKMRVVNFKDPDGIQNARLDNDTI